MNIYYSNFTRIIILEVDHSIPRIKDKKISEQSGNQWWTKVCKQAITLKKGEFKKGIKNRTEENCVSIKRAKIQCNRVMTEVKQSYWTEFCKMKYQNQKTCIKYGQMLNLSPLVIRLRKTKRRIPGHSSKPVSLFEFPHTVQWIFWDLGVFCIKYYNSWYWWYLILNAEPFLCNLQIAITCILPKMLVKWNSL